jgi:mannose-6-phosphate isomerase-like protein (cupin superfamily)
VSGDLILREAAEPALTPRCRGRYGRAVPIVRPDDMLHGEPLPGWRGRFFHSAAMTFSCYDIAADATALHEHQHAQEEVCHVVEGEVVVSIAGVEHTLTAGCAAVVPPETPHAVRPVADCRVVIADFPLRPSLPGMTEPAPSFGT